MMKEEKLDLTSIAAGALAYALTPEQEVTVGGTALANVEIVRSDLQVVNTITTDTFETGLSYTLQVTIPPDEDFSPFNTYCFAKLVRKGFEGVPSANAATVLNGASDTLMTEEDLTRIEIVCCADLTTWLGEDRTDTNEVFDVHIVCLQYANGIYKFTIYTTRDLRVTAV